MQADDLCMAVQKGDERRGVHPLYHMLLSCQSRERFENAPGSHFSLCLKP